MPDKVKPRRRLDNHARDPAPEFNWRSLIAQIVKGVPLRERATARVALSSDPVTAILISRLQTRIENEIDGSTLSGLHCEPGALPAMTFNVFSERSSFASAYANLVDRIEEVKAEELQSLREMLDMIDVECFDGRNSAREYAEAD